MKINFQETIKQKTDDELEIISRDSVFYSEKERSIALNELKFRHGLTEELSEDKKEPTTEQTLEAVKYQKQIDRVVLEKISVLETMKSAFHLWKKHFSKIILIGFIVYIPTQLCIEFVSTLINPENMQLANSVYSLIREIIGSIAWLGIINFYVKILENNEEQTVNEIVRHGLKKWPSFIGLSILAGFKILGYTLLLIIPGIYKGVRLSFLDCVVATNTDDTVYELDESERLVENHWWKVFGFMLLLPILGLLIELLFLPLIIVVPDSPIFAFIGVFVLVAQTYVIVLKANYYFNIREFKRNNVVSEELNNEHPF